MQFCDTADYKSALRGAKFLGEDNLPSSEFGRASEANKFPLIRRREGAMA